MDMHNPALDEMMKTSDDQKAQTTSTLDLKEPYNTWSDRFKYKKSDSQL